MDSETMTESAGFGLGFSWAGIHTLVESILPHDVADHEDELVEIVEAAQYKREMRPPSPPPPPIETPEEIQTRARMEELARKQEAWKQEEEKRKRMTVTYHRLLLTGGFQQSGRAAGGFELELEPVAPTGLVGIPSALWKPIRNPPLIIIAGFESAMRRMDEYAAAWMLGKGAENAFDEKALEQSIITEDLVATTDMVSEESVRANGGEFASRSLEKWKKVVRMDTESGREFYRWTDFLIRNYGVMLELRRIDYKEYVRENMPETQTQMESQENVQKRLLRLHFTDADPASARRRRRNRRNVRLPSESESGSDQTRAFRKLKKLMQEQAQTPDIAIPYARLVVHHSTIAVLRHYGLSGYVRIAVSGVRNPGRVGKDKDPILGTESWGKLAWDMVSGDGQGVDRYSYYQDPRDVEKTYEELEKEKRIKMQRCEQNYWKTQADIPIRISKRRRDNRIPCDILSSSDSEDVAILKAPMDSRKGKVCIQVVLSLKIPWKDDHGAAHVTDVSFAPTSDPGIQKQTPFNCDDPFCDGIQDKNCQCMQIPLDTVSWVDETNKVKMEVDASVLHRLTFPFAWGHSYVRADVQVHNPHVDGMSGFEAALNVEQDECGDIVKYIHVSNVSFVCCAEVMQLALSELLEYERRNAKDPVSKEVMRSASMFLRRAK
jgi:hypothetical protein